VKHKYLVMWHPGLGWGAPIPSLHRCKDDVMKATGLTPQKVRQVGWKWLTVWIDTPDGKDDIEDFTGGPKTKPPKRGREGTPSEAVDVGEDD
jgi:hypothetical protein